MGRLVRATQLARVSRPHGAPESVLGASEDAKDAARKGDGYVERVAKYIPAEIVAFYLFANNILKQSIDGAKAEAVNAAKAEAAKAAEALTTATAAAKVEAVRVAEAAVKAAEIAVTKAAGTVEATMADVSVSQIGWWVFIVAWFATPAYLYRVAKPGDAWIMNPVVAFLLFPFWAYAIQGVGPTSVVPFDGDFASILLGAVTLASGLLKPSDSAAPPNVGGNGDSKDKPAPRPAPQVGGGGNPVPAMGGGPG